MALLRSVLPSPSPTRRGDDEDDGPAASSLTQGDVFMA